MDMLIVLIALAFIITLYTLYSVIYKQNTLEPLELVKAPDVTGQLEPNFETGEELFPNIEFPPDPVKEFVPSLPEGYNDNNITIMARDPEWFFAYWNLNDAYYKELKESHHQKWDNSYPVLRVYDVTGLSNLNTQTPHQYFDIRINDDADNWYIKIPQPNRAYCIELGRILQDGTFLMLLRSNAAHAPRNTVSDKIDPNWMLVSDKEKKLFGAIGHQEGLSSAALIKNSQDH